MNTGKWKRIIAAGLALGTLTGAGLAGAQDITALEDGYLTFTNGNPALYYRVEFKPNLTGLEAWDGTYAGLKNIQTNTATVTVPVGVFYRVVGSSNPVPVVPVAKTGAGDLLSYTEEAGEDGHGSMRKGVAWPNPRFTDNGNGTVTDNVTGLIWLKNASAFVSCTWTNALSDCATLNSGEMGLIDGSVEGDWRLPNVQELQSLIAYGNEGPALCNTAGTGQWIEDDPFTGVQSAYYWSSTTYAFATHYAWMVALFDGNVYGGTKTSSRYVWPVRGGE